MRRRLPCVGLCRSRGSLLVVAAAGAAAVPVYVHLAGRQRLLGVPQRRARDTGTTTQREMRERDTAAAGSAADTLQCDATKATAAA